MRRLGDDSPQNEYRGDSFDQGLRRRSRAAQTREPLLSRCHSVSIALFAAQQSERGEHQEKIGDLLNSSTGREGDRQVGIRAEPGRGASPEPVLSRTKMTTGRQDSHSAATRGPVVAHRGQLSRGKVVKGKIAKRPPSAARKRVGSVVVTGRCKSMLCEGLHIYAESSIVAP